MIAAGTDLFVLQRRLGHESITTTTETYAHLLPDQQRAAADAASRALAGLVDARHAEAPQRLDM
jgi:integrase